MDSWVYVLHWSPSMSQMGWKSMSLGQNHTLAVDKNSKAFALGRYEKLPIFGNKLLKIYVPNHQPSVRFKIGKKY